MSEAVAINTRAADSVASANREQALKHVARSRPI